MSSLLTIDEYRDSSHGQDTFNLVGSDLDGNNAELGRKIAAASSWVEGITDCSLVAARSVEMLTITARPGGLSIHPRNPHLNQLVSLRVGRAANALTDVSVAGAWIEEQQFRIPFGLGASYPPIEYGARTGKLLAQLEYVPGWPNTTVAADVAAGASTITVATTVGFTPTLGSTIGEEDVRIVDGRKSETIRVQSVAGNVLTLAAPLAHDHKAGAVVTQLPAAIKEAATMATSAHLRHRGSDAIVMSQSVSPVAAPSNDSYRWKLLADAKQLLARYVRVR